MFLEYKLKSFSKSWTLNGSGPCVFDPFIGPVKNLWWLKCDGHNISNAQKEKSAKSACKNKTYNGKVGMTLNNFDNRFSEYRRA